MTSDNQTTAIALRVLGNRFVQIVALIATVIFVLPEVWHAGTVVGTVSANWLCKTLGIVK